MFKKIQSMLDAAKCRGEFFLPAFLKLIVLTVTGTNWSSAGKAKLQCPVKIGCQGQNDVLSVRLKAG